MAGAGAGTITLGATPSQRLSKRLLRRPGGVGLDSLDDDTATVVLSFLTPAELSRLSGVSRRTRDVCRDPDLWRSLLARDFRIMPSTTPRGTRVAALRGGPRSALDGGSNNGDNNNNNGEEGGGGHGDSGRVGRIPSLLSAGLRIASAGRFGRTASAGSAGGSDTGAALFSEPFVGYKRLYAAHQEQVRRAREHAQREERRAAASSSRRKIRVCLDVAQFPCGVGVLACFPFLTVLLLTLRLVTGLTSLPYWAIFLPMLLLPCHWCACACLGAAVERCANNAPDTSMFNGLDEGDTNNIVDCASNIWEYYSDARCFKRTMSGCTLASLVICFLFIWIAVVLKLEGVIAASWGVVFIPIWLIACCGWLLPIVTGAGLPGSDGCERFMAVLAYALVAAPIVTVLIVVALMLDGANIRLVFAFIPFFIIDALAACSCCISACVLCIRRPTGDDLVVGRIMVASFSTVLVVAAITQVWPSVIEWRERYVPAGPILVTATVLAGVFVILGCVLSYALCREARSNAFRDLYNRGCLRNCLQRRGAADRRLLPEGGAAIAVRDNPMRAVDDLA